MNIKSISRAAAKKTIPAVLLCAGALATNMAHAGWLAQFLCSGDNDPKLCMSHFSLAVQSAPLPAYSDAAAAGLKAASALKGNEKNAFIEKNSQLFLGVPSSSSNSFTQQKR
jgi:hypothetical protein